jgi:hypothetical protein
MTIPPNNTTLSQSLYTQQSGTTSSNPFITVYSIRDPTPVDINYPIQKRWVNFALVKEWILENFNSTSGTSVANWVLLSNGSGPANIVSFTNNQNGNVATPVLGNIIVSAPSSQIVVDTSGNTISLSLAGGSSAIERVNVQTGTTPIVPLAGAITINGAVVAAGTNPIRSDGTGANTLAIEVQISQALAATDATKIGLSNFNNAQFTVDVNGFVSLVGGTGPAVTGLIPNTFTAPGTSPVLPLAGNITLEGGATFATGTQAFPIRTNSLAANTMDFQIQLAGSNAAVSTANNFGVSQFDSNQFTVASGFVQLKGGGTAPALTKLAMQTGTTPVVPDVTGQITLNGATVSAGTNPIRSNGTGANTAAIEIQFSQAIAATNATNVGLSAFNSAQFTVDANGFVSIIGGSAAIEKVNVQTGTSPIVPSSGTITINGAVVAAGTNPVRTDGTGANTLAIEVQISQALAAADSTKIGLSNFSSAGFGVAATGFVTLATSVAQLYTANTGTATPSANNLNVLGGGGIQTAGSGSTITIAVSGGGFTWTDVTTATQSLVVQNGYLTDRGAGVTYTLPATASIGDTIKIVGKLGLATITPNANQQILMSSASGTVGVTGTAVATNVGDCIELICTTSGASTVWRADNWVGNWTLN